MQKRPTFRAKEEFREMMYTKIQEAAVVPGEPVGQYQSLKGLGNDIEFTFCWQKRVPEVLGLTKNLYWFLDFSDVSLMSCSSCHFPSGYGENIL